MKYENDKYSFCNQKEGMKKTNIEISQVKSSHLYLYSAFNNTNCNKALHNIKIGKFVNNVK